MRLPLPAMRRRPLLLSAALWWLTVCPAWPQTPGPRHSRLGRSPPWPSSPRRPCRRRPSREMARAARRCAPSRWPSRSPSTAVWTKPSTPACRRYPTSSRWSPTGASPRPSGPRSGCSSTTPTSTCRMRAWESQPDRMIATEMRRDSNNIRQGDSVAFGLDTFVRLAQRLSIRGERAWRADRRAEHQRAPVQRRLEPGLERARPAASRAAGASRPRCRSSRSAIGPDGRRSGVPGAPHQQVEERDLLPDARAAGVRHRPRQLRGVALSRPWSASKRRRPAGSWRSSPTPSAS